MLKRYDSNRTPDSAWWLSLDESERIDLARSSQRPDEDLPNPRLHAAIHVIVENQVALGSETPAAETLDRLLAEGLERHDAIHAIGSVLASFAYRAIQSAADDAGEVDLQESYWHDLAGLSAQSWRRDR
jgi:hypothetical protein